MRVRGILNRKTNVKPQEKARNGTSNKRHKRNVQQFARSLDHMEKGKFPPRHPNGKIAAKSIGQQRRR